MRDRQIVVDEVADLEPQPGQVVAKVLACGICGSDLHTLTHADEMVEMSSIMAEEAGPVAPKIMDPRLDVVMGHEFSAEVLAAGDNVTSISVGDIVVSLPIVMDIGGIHMVGYDNKYPGGYGEQIALSEVFCTRVPNGLAPDLAALTEPMAVGLHAVNQSRIKQGHSAVVLGCGPVGLAVICALRAVGAETIIASDFSPKRRSLAKAMGATDVVDPASLSPLERWREVDGRKPLVIFEAVGVPGMLEAAVREAPRGAQILVVGVCMTTDSFRPMIAIGKELNFQFAFGYDPTEFTQSLHLIAEGEFGIQPMITGKVSLDSVPEAFEWLADPDAHAKVLVVP